MNQSELKKAQKVIYNGLGYDRPGTISKRGKTFIEIKFLGSSVRLKFKPNVTCEQIGVRVHD